MREAVAGAADDFDDRIQDAKRRAAQRAGKEGERFKQLRALAVARAAGARADE